MRGTSVRILLLCLILILTASFLVGCHVNEALYYESLFDELDIRARLERVSFFIETDQAWRGTKRELRAIKRDLRSIEMEDPELLEINKGYIRSADLLLYAVTCLEEGNLEEKQEKWESAKIAFAQAEKRLNRYKANWEKDHG